MFVFPSIAENFPVCLLEAMLAATAIAATDIKPCREVLGDTAFYFLPGDVTTLRERVFDLLNHEQKRKELAKRARQRVLQQFSWDRGGQQYHDLFFKIAKGKRDNV